MLKKTIKYTDYNGNEREEDFYFNLTKAELIELEASVNGGYTELIKQLINTTNTAEIAKVWKDVILNAYGVKSVDGKRFIKNQDVKDEFVQSEAYSELYMELLSDPKKASAFIEAILPKEAHPDKPDLAVVQ